MRRLSLLVALLAIEVLAVSLAFDAAPQAVINEPDTWLTWLGQAGLFARFLTVTGVALLLLVGPRLRAYARDLAGVHRGGVLVGGLAGVHLLVAAGFFVTTALLFSIPSPLDVAHRPPIVVLWLIGGVALIASWGLVLAPVSFWLRFVRRERVTVALALLAGAVATAVAYQVQYLGQGLAYAALRLAHIVLQLRYDEVVMDPAQLILGVDEFIVQVGYACSGYEGIGLVSVFTALYLYVFRAEFRFPHALWLFPIGIVIIWCFNVLRIAVLIGIGAEISPALALEGFHSQAGWISFLLVSSGILYLAHRSGFAATSSTGSRDSRLRDTLAAAVLLPLIVMVAIGLVTSTLSETIDWLYPLRVLAGFAVLAWVWPTLALGWPRFSLVPVVVGAGVAILWIVLASPDPADDARVTEAWQQQAPLLAWLWLACRLIGAIVLAPVAEELVFRGYLLSRLGRQPILLVGAARFPWIAVLSSAALFGVLHDAWLAGTLAGLAYGWLRQTGASIWAPIMGHAVTNALLAAFVLTTGTWSVW